MSEGMVDWLEGAGARRSSGSEYIMKCPWCMKRQHLYINSEPGVDSDGNDLPAGRFICFSCDEKSLSILKLVVEVDGIEWHEARKLLWAWRVGHIEFKRINPSATKATVAETKPERDGTLPPEFEPLWDGTKWLWPKYLTRRGLDRDLACRMGLGVCRSGEYVDRVIMPIVCPNGSSFTARSIKPDAYLRYKAGPNAGRLLYGWQGLDGTKDGLIVEGPFDCLAAYQAGIPSVALMGLRLRDEQLDMLASSKTKWTVMLDGSADALTSAARIARKLPGTRVAYCPAGRKDPGESTAEELRASYANSVPADEARLAALAAVEEERSQRPICTLGMRMRAIAW